MKYLLTSEDPYAVIHHPWQPAMLKAHILAAPVLVFALGVIFSRHVVARWKSGRRTGRSSGALIVAVAAPMVLSGYALQTLTSRTWVVAASWTHLTTGFLFLLGFALHQTAATLRERRRVAASPAPGRRNGASPAASFRASDPVPEED